ncbi:MAG TPA: O-antigen ligase family protein, partial [Mycobacteriales bacterium]|nr:O-antigen ligase family protein [Mycobacteriales bacterium]
PRIRRTPPHLYLGCFFVGLMVLSVTYSAYPQYALVRAGQMCVLLGLTMVAAHKATRADLHWFAHGYIALIAVSVVYGVFVHSTPITKLQAGRFTWLAIHPTVSGVLTGLAALLAAGYLAAKPRSRPGPVWSRAAYASALVIVGRGALASQTRGAVAGCLVGIVVLLLALRGGRAIIELQVILVVVGIAVALLAGGRVVDYFARGETSAQISTLNSRTEVWATARTAIAHKPMFGYGVTASRGLFYDTLNLGGGHNAAVNVFVELGMVGLAAWLALLIALVFGIRRIPIKAFPGLRVDRALLLGVITFLLIDGVFYEGLGATTNVASTWFFVCIAWLSVARRDTGDETPGEPAKLRVNGVPQ